MNKKTIILTVLVVVILLLLLFFGLYGCKKKAKADENVKPKIDVEAYITSSDPESKFSGLGLSSSDKLDSATKEEIEKNIEIYLTPTESLERRVVSYVKVHQIILKKNNEEISSYFVGKEKATTEELSDEDIIHNPFSEDKTIEKAILGQIDHTFPINK